MEKKTRKLGLDGQQDVARRGTNTRGYSCEWTWPQVKCLSCFWLTFAVVLTMNMICVWGNPLAGYGRVSNFSIMIHFPSSWPKEGVWWEADMKNTSRNGRERKNNHQNFRNPELALLTDRKSSEFTPANVNFTVSREIFGTFSNFRRFWDTLVSHSLLLG